MPDDLKSETLKPSSGQSAAQNKQAQVPADKQPARPTASFDWHDWLSYLEDFEGSESEKQQLIETLWQIILAFVDLGWDVKGNEAVEAQKACGQTHHADLDLSAILRATMVELDTETSNNKEEI